MARNTAEVHGVFGRCFDTTRRLLRSAADSEDECDFARVVSKTMIHSANMKADSDDDSVRGGREKQKRGDGIQKERTSTSDQRHTWGVMKEKIKKRRSDLMIKVDVDDPLQHALVPPPRLSTTRDVIKSNLMLMTPSLVAQLPHAIQAQNPPFNLKNTNGDSPISISIRSAPTVDLDCRDDRMAAVVKTHEAKMAVLQETHAAVLKEMAVLKETHVAEITILHQTIKSLKEVSKTQDRKLLGALTNVLSSSPDIKALVDSEEESMGNSRDAVGQCCHTMQVLATATSVLLEEKGRLAAEIHSIRLAQRSDASSMETDMDAMRETCRRLQRDMCMLEEERDALHVRLFMAEKEKQVLEGSVRQLNATYLKMETSFLACCRIIKEIQQQHQEECKASKGMHNSPYHLSAADLHTLYTFNLNNTLVAASASGGLANELDLAETLKHTHTSTRTSPHARPSPYASPFLGSNKSVHEIGLHATPPSAQTFSFQTSTPLSRSQSKESSPSPTIEMTLPSACKSRERRQLSHSSALLFLPDHQNLHPRNGLKNNTSKSPSSLVDNNTRTDCQNFPHSITTPALTARTSPIHSIVDEAIGTERKGILKDTAVSFRKFPSEEDDTFHEKGISRASADSRASREDQGKDLEAEMGIVGQNLNRLTTTWATADLATRVAKAQLLLEQMGV